MQAKLSRNRSAFTLVDAVVVIAVVAMLMLLCLPALSHQRDDAHVAECSQHLKQLGDAAYAYADDFEGKFFYDWPSKINPAGELQPEALGYWFDRKRAGRYVDGRPMRAGDRLVPLPQPSQGKIDVDKEAERASDDGLGLGGDVFVCPADPEPAGRSYHMNLWASGIGPTKAWQDRRPKLGEFFDRTAPQLDRLFLFTDVMGLEPTLDGWVTAGFFGRDFLPGERFGGPREAEGACLDSYGRFGGTRRYPVCLDYVRHGDNDDRMVPDGAVNFAFADGHVALKRSDALYDPQTKQSTYAVLWSRVDQELED